VRERRGEIATRCRTSRLVARNPKDGSSDPFLIQRALNPLGQAGRIRPPSRPDGTLERERGSVGLGPAHAHPGAAEPPCGSEERSRRG
jgi:hypothetical protein